jgi:hypothetical protein
VLPVPNVAADTDFSGRGLLIVQMLTAALWVEPRAYDKTTYAVLTRPGVMLTPAELDRIGR